MRSLHTSGWFVCGASTCPDCDTGARPLDGSVLVLATELLPGASLAQHSSIGQEAVEDAMAALSAVHSAGMLHGDICADNVMILLNGVRPCVRLIDFGFAQDAGADQMRQEMKKFKQLLDRHVCNMICSGSLLYNMGRAGAIVLVHGV